MYKTILLPIDLADDSSWKRALTVASELAKPSNAELHVITVVPNFGQSIVASFFDKGFEKKATEETKKKLQEFLKSHAPDDVTVKGHVVCGTIYEEILDVANQLDCDLIVLGSHRPELSDYLLGPNAARIVRHAKQSVMVVRD
jgi:nucleotide-binding universal stress UspA family protein